MASRPWYHAGTKACVLEGAGALSAAEESALTGWPRPRAVGTFCLRAQRVPFGSAHGNESLSANSNEPLSAGTQAVDLEETSLNRE